MCFSSEEVNFWERSWIKTSNLQSMFSKLGKFRIRSDLFETLGIFGVSETQMSRNNATNKSPLALVPKRRLFERENALPPICHQSFVNCEIS